MGGFAQAAGELGKIARQQAAAGPRAAALAALAVQKSAADIEADAKALVPVDTGNLRSSISRDISESTFSGSGTTFTAEVGPTANYGAYVEYGTSRARPQPYMGPAFTRRVPGFVKAMEQIPLLAMKGTR